MARQPRKLAPVAPERSRTPERIEVDRNAETLRVRVTSPEADGSQWLDESGMLGRYHVLERIGEGGMGRAYAAWDPILQRVVVLKLLSLPDSRDLCEARFAREVRALAAQSHPNVVTIYDYCTVGETHFAVLEYLDGPTLRELMQNGKLPMSHCLRIGSQIVEGLVAVHEHGIVHRDVKPENVLTAEDGRVKLLDFGLSKRGVQLGRNGDQNYAGSEQEKGRLVGTIAYMSPEQARGDDVDGRSDIFSFGIVLYEMLTGEHPFCRETAADTLRAIMSDPPPNVPRCNGLSRELLQIAVRCLRKVPHERYASTCRLASTLSGLYRAQLCAGRTMPTIHDAIRGSFVDDQR